MLLLGSESSLVYLSSLLLGFDVATLELSGFSLLLGVDEESTASSENHGSEGPPVPGQVGGRGVRLLAWGIDFSRVNLGRAANWNALSKLELLRLLVTVKRRQQSASAKFGVPLDVLARALFLSPGDALIVLQDLGLPAIIGGLLDSLAAIARCFLLALLTGDLTLGFGLVA